MAEIPEELMKEVQDILDRERWQGYVSGKVEGALNVLYAMDLDKDKRLGILMEAVDLSNATATDTLKPREIEYRIYKKEDLTDDEKAKLATLMKNKAMDDERVLDHPKQTLKFIAAMGGEKFIEESLPQVDAWVEGGEDVSVSRVKNWLIEKYDLF